ncbi:hypothetical protein [Microbispora rosea]|uniref:hypothetical protein n=1 Tax=Microbispora rosea TaxID=58117 RepID=UPI0037A2C093
MTHHNRRLDTTPAPKPNHPKRRPGPAYWAACTITSSAAALTAYFGPTLRGLASLAVCVTAAAIAYVIGRETEGR